LGGRNCIFVTGIAGLLVGAWALTNVGVLYGIPLLILASYRGDVGDRSGIAGNNLFMFTQVGEPLLDALRVPYRIVSDKGRLKQTVRDAQFSCRQYSSPIVLLLSGEVLW
jgi:sulfopyruvate decarboxylase subunit alpha